MEHSVYKRVFNNQRNVQENALSVFGPSLIVKLWLKYMRNDNY